MIKKIILIALILILIGCKKVEQLPPAATEAEEVSIESDMSEIDSLTEDLDIDELENIESDLDAIDW